MKHDAQVNRAGETAAPQGFGRGGWPACLLVLLFLLAGCATPVGTTRTGFRNVFGELSSSALEGRLSDATLAVVRRYDLEEQCLDDPEGTLARLHERAGRDDRRDLLYALAELNYQHGTRLEGNPKPGAARRAPDFFLSSAIYAWFYLFGEGEQPSPTPFDERFRVTCNLYNRALARAFAEGPRTNSVVRPAGGSRPLPPGAVEVRLAESATQALVGVDKLLAADEFRVRGLSVRNRQSGVGAPLIAVIGADANPIARQRLPMTLLLRVPGDVQAWSRGGLTVSLELYSAFQTNQVQVGTQTVPLESDLTAPLADRLNNSHLWKLGRRQFFSAQEVVKSDLYMMGRYQPGRIPVIFVHGTFSSPVWWAEMVNTLEADPVLREKYQFWTFIYNSGNPVTYSASKLRTAIAARIQSLDPAGADEALRKIVVVGHSQGGLLAKLTAVDTGSELWHAYASRDFDTLDLPATERERLRDCFFFKPLPGVKRVVFIATPHRGAFRNSHRLQRFLSRFMKLPGEVIRGTGVLLQVADSGDIPPELRRTGANSLFGMSVGNKITAALAEIPVSPGVKSHSIIAIRGDGPPEQGDDGVVKYASAHVDYADSEFIVRSGHSCQDKPPAIEEVRRILHEHLAGLAPRGDGPAGHEP